MLGKGDPKVTFLVGMVLSFPGVSYLTALDKIHHLDPGTVPTVLLVIGFCLMQQILLEIPLLGYIFAPDRTQDTVTRFKDWMARKGRSAAVIGAAVIGVLLGRQGSDHAVVMRKAGLGGPARWSSGHVRLPSRIRLPPSTSEAGLCGDPAGLDRRV